MRRAAAKQVGSIGYIQLCSAAKLPLRCLQRGVDRLIAASIKRNKENDMFAIEINKENYEYDIQALVKSF